MSIGLTSISSKPHYHYYLPIQEIKALVRTSEHQVQIAKEALKATERGIEEAYERNRIARANHDGLVLKLANLKAQFKEQIMEDGLKESNRWNEMYYKLLQWKESHDGDVLVPVDKDSDEDTKKLSRWVINQRSAYKYKYFINGDTKHIKDHRIDALNKVGRGLILVIGSNRLSISMIYFLTNTYSWSLIHPRVFLKRSVLFGV